jgi:hypothetical protein
MDRECSTNGKEKECIQDICGIIKKETTRMTKT